MNDDVQKKLKMLRELAGAIGAVRALRQVSADDLLARAGLERKRSAAEQAGPWVGGFAAGFLAGGATGLLFAPMKGKKLRAKIRKEAARLRESWLGYGRGTEERPGGEDAAQPEAGEGQPGAHA